MVSVHVDPDEPGIMDRSPERPMRDDERSLHLHQH
jgi:hypothetical protein